MPSKVEPALNSALEWFSSRNWQAFDFQKKTWKHYLDGYNGILNAPTGSGKTYALGLGILLEFMLTHKNYAEKTGNGLQVIWITPLRALSKEIRHAINEACEALNIPWEIAVRTGDTSTSERNRQRKKMPEFLITTPESLHILMSSKGYEKYFKHLKCVIADEWHELIGTKRAVQVELALSRLKALRPELKIWGISATIGNMDEALDVLLGNWSQERKTTIIRGDLDKKITVTSVLPDEIEKFPWAGHLGIRLLDKVIPIIKASKTSLIFTNTRSQSEIWYQKILDVAPELAGTIALHHGSISRELRDWVEENLHSEKLKAVVCTSSLDLGVDFRPVETIIQIGGPKGIARFMQRAGRSGHRPGAVSHIYFVPTHSLEIIEGAALRKGIDEKKLESRLPFIRSFDVLIQYLLTLAVSDGFHPPQIYREIKSTFSYRHIDEAEWFAVLNFIVTGGEPLEAYDEYKKVVVEDGVYKVTNRRIAQKHRLSIGTIVGDNVLKVKYLSGKFIGTIEEYFVTNLKPGDTFWFAGRNLEFIRIKALDVIVRKTNHTKGKVASWMGARMPLSSQMSAMIRTKINEALEENPVEPELKKIRPLIEKQQEISHVPREDEFLIERLESKEGYHVFMYPFEGRFVHEGIASLVAFRIAQVHPISFSIALNDYGFELLADQPIAIEEALELDLFTDEDLMTHIQASLNSTEMARTRFRIIAAISGLTFKGFPGKYLADRHIQASARLFFDIFETYDHDNLLYRQAFQEVMEFQLEESRMRSSMKRIQQQKLILKDITRPSPFAFPILVDRLSRDRMTNETLEERIKKMKLQIDD